METLLKALSRKGLFCYPLGVVVALGEPRRGGPAGGNVEVMFRKIEALPDFPKLERRILEFWKKENIFKKSVANRRGGPPFVFYEGPPTANGKPHIGHVLARAFKDLFPRYKTMRGFYCERKGGWDTHGLPVEIEVEKRLGLSGKKEIEEYGMAAFNKKCRESVFRYVKDWEELTARMGFWLDMETPYVTLENDYIESCWWALKKFWEEGLLVRDYKVVPYCPRCGTSLSSHEVAQGYEEVEDPSLYVKFPVRGERNIFFLVWTTTPWTLPGNVALAVDPRAEYARVKLGGECVILARDRESILPQPYEIEATREGKDLLGLEYEPLYKFLEYEKRAHYVVPAEFVSLEEGTGIVHTAVMYGEEDFELGRKFNLPRKHLVDGEGKFVKRAGKLAGKFVKEADPVIVEDLRKRGLLFREAKIRHAYPFCWRCHGPLLYYALESWFIKTTARKKALIRQNGNTRWVPDHLRKGRMGNWLETLIDWNLSRNRYWGTPLPVWICDRCHRTLCVGSIEELRRRAEPLDREKVAAGKLDLHRPFVDEIRLRCPGCRGKMRRVPEVIDAWFDSGAMPFAQWHYPFENKEKFKARFPADFIAEAMDQTRGWFYSLLAVNTLAFGETAYKNVISTGLVLDERGKKMSKHLGNVVDPGEVIEKTGIDAIRWYFYSSTVVGNEYRFGVKAVEDVRRRILLILWNCFKFFTVYANADKVEVIKIGQVEPKELGVLDRWILSRLNRLVGTVTKSLDDYDAFTATQAVETFISDFSNWYIRRSRGRVGPTVPQTPDKDSFYKTVYRVFSTLVKLLAPFTPFFAEEIYQGLALRMESVHLEDWPEVCREFLDGELERRMGLVRRLCELGRARRKAAGIKVRQPLAKLKVRNAEFKVAGQHSDLLRECEKLIKEELNVKEVEFVGGKKGGELSVELDVRITPELKAEGEARELVRAVQALRKKAGCNLGDRIAVTAPSWPRSFEAYIKREVLAEAIREGKKLSLEVVSP